jgi:putative flippase GtrA
MLKFLVKWVLNGAIVTLLLSYFTGISYWTAFIAASVLTIIAYFVGDQFILRQSNNTVATIMDGVMAVLYLLVLEFYFDWGLSWAEIFTIAAVLAVAEAFLHRYIFQQENIKAT